MNLRLSPELAEMRETVLAFAHRDLAPHEHGDAGDVGDAADTADADRFRARWRLAGRQGLTGVTVPAEYGGSGLDAESAAVLMEALGEGCTDTGFAFSVAAHLFACLMPIVEFGTDDQKRRWLPDLCSGEKVAAHGVTEPGAGSDSLNLSTRAERKGDHYVLDGGKCFTTNAPVADVFVVQAATRPSGGFFGLTSFIVDATTPGLRVGRPYEKTGLRGSPTADVYFENCIVPADSVLGAEGSGATVFTGSMKWERTCLFAIYLGAMRRVLDDTLTFASEREQFGSPIGRFQAVSHRIVDMVLSLESARLLLLDAARRLAAGEDCDVPSALAKLAVSEAAVKLGLDAVQVRGSGGVLEGDAGALLRDALPARIFSGTNEIQKNNIARALGIGRRRPARR